MIWWSFPFFAQTKIYLECLIVIFFWAKYFAGDFRVGFFIIQYESTYRIDKQYTNSSKTRRINDMDYFLKKIRIGIPRLRTRSGQKWSHHMRTSRKLLISDLTMKSHLSLMEHESNDFRHVLEFMEVNPRELIKVMAPRTHIYCNSRNSRNRG